MSVPAAAVGARRPAALAAAPRSTWRAIAPATLMAATLAAVYLIWQPPSADLAAQEFRTWLFDQQGFTPWDGQWFGGHHTPGYSVLFPPLASLLGPRLVGAIATVAGAALFAAIADGVWGERSRVGALWFGAAVTASLFNGRMTFALGVAVGLAAILAMQRDRHLLGYACAVLTGLASPVAALFLALAGCAWAIGDRRRLGLGARGRRIRSGRPAGIRVPRGRDGAVRDQRLPPRPRSSARSPLVVAARRRAGPAHRGGALRGWPTCAAFLLDTPMGGNATRLSTLFAGPLLACALWGRRATALAVIAPFLVFLQLGPPIRDVARAQADPAVQRSFYAPLLRFLDQEVETLHEPVRVEVLPTEDHWESRWVATRHPIARGWVRQLDRRYGPLFYEDRLDPAAYRRWVDRLGVSLVAVPAAPLDYAAAREAGLIRRGLPWLVPTFRGGSWVVYRGAAPGRPVDPPIRVTALDPSSVSLTAVRPGTSLLRVRFSPYWALVEGTGCVARGPGGMTRVTLRETGRAAAGDPLLARARAQPGAALPRQRLSTAPGSVVRETRPAPLARAVRMLGWSRPWAYACAPSRRASCRVGGSTSCGSSSS